MGPASSPTPGFAVSPEPPTLEAMSLPSRAPLLLRDLIDDLDEEILADREREAELGLSFTTSRGEPDAA